MSLFRRHPHPDNLDDTDEDEEGIDPDLRLRTVQTAASAIAESIRSEARIQQRRKRKSFRKPGKGRLFGGSRIVEKKDSDAESTMTAATKKVVAGIRRNIYVNLPLPEAEQELNGDPAARYPRNKVRTSSESHLNLDCPARRLLRFTPTRIYYPNIHPEELV
jgi:phospholipid-translocating ATPase